ncbi:MAG: ammonia-forming cytochrome c nitrite reductase subunit c552 [Gemmatimonadales bacterium]
MSFPAPLSEVRDTGATFDDFVGSDECEECHKPEYDAWKASTHGNAGGLPGEVRIIAPFNGATLRFRDAVVTPFTAADGKLAFRVEEQNGEVQVFEVAGVVGGGHMVGGGTQAFFTEYPDGTVRFLPFDYIRQEGVWFCQTAGRSEQGWAPITPDMALSDCNDWPPSRVLGVHDRFANCQQCHGSQILLSYDAAEKRYRTQFTTLAINCESCHGPGRRHIEIADSDSIDSVTDIGAEALATRDKDGSLQVCFQCHAVKAELHPGFISGRPLEESFSDLLLLLSYRPYFPDGRIRLFAYQQQHLYSDCYLNGSMTCVDCHDPHSQHYRDIWGEPLVGRFSDGQCLDCHPSKAEEVEVRASDYDSLWSVDYGPAGRTNPRAASAEPIARINAHTYHRINTPGSRCIDCHMPYLQEPDVGTRLRYSRSDHTIPIPRPEIDALFNIENACVKCHRERSLDDVREKVEEWYGELKPVKRLIDGLINARGIEDRVEAARLMLGPDEPYVALQFTNLAYYFLTYLGPDMPDLEDEVVGYLQNLSESEDPDLQSLALASLHLAHGNDPAVRSYLGGRLRGLGPRDGIIRRRWVWVLDFRGTAYRSRNELQAALTTYRKAEEILPRDAEVLGNLGIVQGDLADYSAATDYFRRSLEVDSQQPHVLASLAFALAMQGDFESSTAVYREAIELNPYSAATYYSLGNALMRGRNLEGAVNAYLRAVALEPAKAEAHFALAQAYQLQNRLEPAIAALERGLEYNRRNPAARQLLARLRDEVAPLPR